MPFVLDASLAMTWAIEDEGHPIADVAIERLRVDEAFVPNIWWYEVRNSLLMNERRNRINKEDTAFFLHELSRLSIKIDFMHDQDQVLALARRHRLTFYDSAYLEIAIRRSCQLATFDKALMRAARSEKVPLLDR
jgi:predicted nucleic acid-binding protein